MRIFLIPLPPPPKTQAAMNDGDAVAYAANRLNPYANLHSEACSLQPTYTATWPRSAVGLHPGRFRKAGGAGRRGRAAGRGPEKSLARGLTSGPSFGNLNEFSFFPEQGLWERRKQDIGKV